MAPPRANSQVKAVTRPGVGSLTRGVDPAHHRLTMGEMGRGAHWESAQDWPPACPDCVRWPLRLLAASEQVEAVVGG